MHLARVRRALRPDRAGGEDGISLIEVMIAMFILSVGIFALASTAIASLQSTRISRERQDAMQLASTTIENARAQSWETVALNLTEYDPAVDGASYDGETLIAYADGAVPHEVVDGPLTARAWVTWSTALENEKRVTVEVSWNDRGAREVVQSTLVAEARRGLPVPNFQVEPTLIAQDETEGQVSCFDHTLTNLGERDSYSWQLLHEDATGALAPATRQTRPVVEDGNTVTREGFMVTSAVGEGWFAWARMGDTTTTFHPMVDLTSDQRPDSVNPVDRRSQAVVRVCYTPNDAGGALQSPLDDQPRFTVRMHSAFDESVVREFEDSLSIIEERQTLYLHHPRKDNNKIDVDHEYKLMMDPFVPTHTDSGANYEKNNLDSHPGLRLGAYTASFDYQNTGSDAWTLVSENAQVFVAVATDETLAGDASSPDVRVTYTLRRVQADDTVSGALGTVTDYEDIDEDDPWDLSVASIPVTSTTIGPNEYLRLDVSCETTTGTGSCHLHYDVQGAFESQIRVTLQ